jgi:nucleotide-binding universal stress UspA family protein
MPLTIQTVVCAVDFSSFSPMVVDYGAALAQRTGVRLYLLHAVHEPQDNLHPTAVFERGGDLTHLTDEARRRLRELMTDALVDWEPVVRFGDPVEQTVAFVNDLPRSLVVSASHGVSGFRRFFIGTVVERLTRALNRPMLVVKPGDDEMNRRFTGFRSAVIGCDDHGHWQRLAPLLPVLQTDSASRIHMVHCMEGPMATSPGDDDAVAYNQVQQARQDRLKRRLREQAWGLFPLADRLSIAVEPGIPEEMILRVAREKNADIIAVGVRHGGKVRRWLAGSTTEALLRRATCSVLTVPEAAQPIEPGGDVR